MSTRRRLTSAALELFERNGYRGTTVAQIADAADLSERSFFRYFADKDEVLFLDDAQLQEAVIATLGVDSADIWSQLRSGLNAAGSAFGLSREQYRARRRVIASHPNLQGREQVKHVQMQVTLAETLTEHGYSRHKASLLSRVTVMAWVEAMSRWSGDEPRARRANSSDEPRARRADSEPTTLAGAIDQVVDDLRELFG
jgi:AcrR family transcriptional regulator